MHTTTALHKPGWCGLAQINDVMLVSRIAQRSQQILMGMECTFSWEWRPIDAATHKLQAALAVTANTKGRYTGGVQGCRAAHTMHTRKVTPTYTSGTSSTTGPAGMFELRQNTPMKVWHKKVQVRHVTVGNCPNRTRHAAVHHVQGCGQHVLPATA